MRVRILRGPSAGRVVILPDAEALELLQQGAVEEDAMLPGPSEYTALGALPDLGETGLNGLVTAKPLPRTHQDGLDEGGEASRYRRTSRTARARR